MNKLVASSSPTLLACGFSLCLLAMVWPMTVAGQGTYQVQGNYNGGPAPAQSNSASLMPQAYRQQSYPAQAYPPQGFPRAGTGLPRSTMVYSPQTPTYQPNPYAGQPYPPQNGNPSRANRGLIATPVYSPGTPSGLPPAYAQQGMYDQPQPYPGSVQPVPHQTIYDPHSVSGEISALKVKDREQDRRLSALEGRNNRPSPSPTPAIGYTKHTVSRGESLWGIAERYGVSESSIKAANRRTSDMVIEGETLLIPDSSNGGTYVPPTPGLSGGTHIVQRGESLSEIAASYRVSLRSLQEVNGITNPDFVQEGQPLVIPGGSKAVSKPKPRTTSRQVSKSTKPKQTVVYSDVPAPEAGAGTVEAISGPRGVTSYRVEASDKIESVARTFNTTPAEIQRINKLSSPALPAAGEEIIVPMPGSLAL